MNKKILIYLSTILVVAAISIGGTIAYFSDTEKSVGNTFVAGEIDLLIDNTCHYNGKVCTKAAGAEKYYWEGTQEECFCSWEKKNLTKDDLFFNFLDLKPGDNGEDTVSIHVGSNDAWVCAELTNLVNNENKCNDPEQEIDQTCDNPGPGQGELQNHLVFTVWRDTNCDNVLDPDEVPIVTDQPASQGNWPIADKTTGIPVPAGKDTCIGVGWKVLSSENDNIIQTDGLTGDIEFSAVQSRNNDNFVCIGSTPPPPVTGLKEYYNINDNNMMDFYEYVWEAQTFTAESSYKINSVKLKMFKSGDINDVMCSIRSTAGGYPVGPDLASATLDGNSFSTSPGNWEEWVFDTPYQLESGTKYAIVCRCPDCNTWVNGARWRMDYNGATYNNGELCESITSGASWLCPAYGGATDMMFENYGS